MIVMFQFCNILSYKAVRFALASNKYLPVKTVPFIPSRTNHFLRLTPGILMKSKCDVGTSSKIREDLSRDLPGFQFV